MRQTPRPPNMTKRPATEIAADTWSVAGHDLRQPLQALAFSIRTLGSDCSERDRLAAASGASQSLESLDEMIGTLIEIARLSNGRQAPDTQPSKLERIVGDVVIQCNPFAVAANRPIELAAFTVDVATDARLCSAAVKGLLLYAIKHGTGDRTAIDVHRRGRSIRLDIAYDGPPPDAALAKQAFIQLAPVAGAPAVPPRPMQGIGLALAPQLCACLGLGFEHGRSRSRSHRLSLVFRR